MMKKKKFNRKLYIEGLRQLKTLGFLGLVICSIIACLIPIGNYIEQKSMFNDYGASNYTPHIMQAVTSHLYFYLAAVVFVPLMVIHLFRFLNYREDSDFYHAIPHTRLCIFTSFSAAVITWTFVLLAVPTVFSAICYYFARHFIIIDIASIFLFAGNMFVVSLLIAAALLLAVSLCGNIFSAVFVFLILLFVPRIFLTIYSALLTNRLDFLTDVLHLFQWKNNQLFAIPIYLFRDFDTLYGMDYYSQCITFNGATLYTLILSLILLFLAAWAFTKRKSETAGSSMASRFLQITFRTIFVMLICLIPLSLIYFRRVALMYDYENSYEYDFYIVVAYLFSLLGLFLYELITTRSAKSACKSFKSLPLIIALNVVFFFLLLGAEKYYSSYRLEADKVTSVNVLDGYSNFYDNDYFEEEFTKYEFTDSELIEKLCSNLNHYIENYEDIQYRTYYSEDVSTYEYDEELGEYVYTSNDPDAVYYPYSFTICFHKAHSSVTFRFYVTTEEYTEIRNIIDADSEAKKIFTTLPELTAADSLSLRSNLSMPDDLNAVYECLREELADGSVDMEQWLAALENPYDTIATLYFYHDNGYNTYEYSFPITSATPKTYQVFYQQYMDTNDSSADVTALTSCIDFFLEKAEENDDDTYGLVLSGNAADMVSDEYVYMIFDTDSIASDQKNLLKALEDLIKPVSEYTENDCLVSYDFYSYYDSLDDRSGLVCFPADDFYKLCKALYQ
jgi:ABC-2 type transport system permease protein